MKAPDRPIIEPCGLSYAQLTKLNDEQVMQHIQAGHDDALAVLFDRYARLVASIGFRILRDPGEAEDITQLVFLEIFQAAAQFDPARGNLKGWLLQYAYHRSLNRRDYLAKRQFYDPGAANAEERSAGEFAGTGCAGAGQLALPELRSLMRQGLAKLTSRQRRTLHMAYFEGKSLREIAEETGESVANIRHYYYRGLKSLRSFISKKNSHDSGIERSTLLKRGAIDVEA